VTVRFFARYAELVGREEAVNLKHVKLDAGVRDGDEVAFLPPVAGG